MLTKTWKCPHCGGEFIVASSSERDVCPWCKTAVQERDGAPVPAQSTPSSSSDDTAPSAAPKPSPPSGQASSDQPLTDVWWPYEYDPF